MIRKRVLKIAILLAVMIIMNEIFAGLLLFNNTGSEVHIRNFYREPKNSIDVAVIGSSEMYADYSPPLAYGEFGFTSYNLCYSGAPGILYSSMLCEYLKRQDPQLVVIEINGFLYNEKLSSRESNIRQWIDNIPKSRNWIETIKNNVQREERADYFFALSKYHSNWENCEQQYKRIENLIQNAKSEVSYMKSFGTKTTKNSQYEEERKETNLNDFGRKQLSDMIDYCKECGLENVLFIRAPHINQMSELCREEFRQIICERGYDFLDCEVIATDIGIDEYSDYYNKEHLNVFGNEKFTKYLGEYIMDNYDISRNHSEKTDHLWEECYQYTTKVYEILKERTLLNEGIYYCEYSNFSEEVYQKNLENLGEK